MFENRFELVRRDGEIKKPVAACAALFVDLVQFGGKSFVAGLVAKIALMIKNRLRERFPDFVTNALSGKFSCRFLHLLPELVITLFASREADNCDGGRQLAIGGKIVKRWHQLAMSEIAGGAENDDAARLWHRARGQTFAQRICLRLLGCSIHGCIRRLRTFPQIR